jgi:hypothetical protein
MSPESKIDIEKAAESTLFFSRVVEDGKSHLHSRINYLALINLHTDVENTVQTIKDIVESEQKEILERDTLVLLQARNWRFHLIACGVMLTGLSSDKLINQLWNVLRQGSWISPQIAATAYLLDPRFSVKALDSILQENFDKQSIVALAELLKQNSAAKFSEEQEARINLAKMEDSADSGEIAVSWVENIRPLFTAT